MTSRLYRTLCIAFLFMRLAVALPGSALAQEPERPNAIFVELFGAAGIGSLNYQRRIGEDWAVQGGAGVFRVSGDERRVDVVLTFPVLVQWLGIGNERHRLELGAGIVPFAIIQRREEPLDAADFPPLAGTALVGYRLTVRRLLFRVGFTPLFPGPSLPFEPRGGISLGATF